ncbi:F-box/kelch-repeat protein At4g39550-like [Cornus florida]|uniref:F-box/kelch-repeat protein At4g39550-like n=1 Tax=Cornus florida TaxID=4283 RepID=UPI00289C6988|nr:F-box/kelch-repeat protein At4g39550-like [Cornus florida]
MDWYEVQLSSSNDRRERKMERKRKRVREDSPPPPFTVAIEPIWKKVETPLWSCCVALGSTIYSIGGCDEIDGYYSEEVRAADMSLRQLRYVAPMTATRSSPHAVTADDKIYVFGGLHGDRKGPEMEVFDPINNMWESITAPSHPIMSPDYDDGFLVTYDEASKKLT